MKSKSIVNPLITVRHSKIHGRGVFAKKAIAKGMRIIEYVGELISKAEAEKRGHHRVGMHKENITLGAVYIFELNKRFDIDGNVAYNKARYINHSCEPNSETEIIRGKIWILALKDIKKGEEIFYNYGYGLESYEDHICHCKTSRCVGYILAEEHWPKLKKRKVV